MKKTTTLLLASLFSFALIPLFAQQVPILQSFSLQPGLFNPAALGAGGASVVYRNQFMDLPKEARPQTYVFHGDFSPLLGERVGLGLLIMADEAHTLKRTQAMGFFAYHLMPPESEFKLSLGMMAGVSFQKFDFTGRRVNDPLELSLLDGTNSATFFEGGFGMKASYTTENKSEAYLHLALPQLYASDQIVESPGSTVSATYDLLPHVLATAGYLYRGSGFALEPSVSYRETIGGKNLKAANFDLNLAVRLLEDDRLTVGGGWRSDEGGIHFLVGVKPIANLMVTGVYEMHSQLGTTFEAGINYTFGPTGCNKTLSAEEQTISTKAATASGAHGIAFNLASPAWDKVAIANSYVKEAEAALSFDTKNEKLERASQNIALAEEALANLKIETRKCEDALGRAENALARAMIERVKPCNADEVEQTRTFYNETKAIENNLAARINAVKRAAENARPRIDLKGWVTNSETENLKNYLSEELGKQTGLPENATLVTVNAKASTLELVYTYPDEVEEYNLDKAAMSKVNAFATYLARSIGQLQRQGIEVESIHLASDIRYSPRGAKFSLGKNYGREFGDKVKVECLFNGKTATISVEKNKSYTFWDMAGLKIFGLRDYLSNKTGIAASKITLEITAPNPDIVPDLKERVVVVLKK
jgi:type IX secretion system PorP/SprF family membrane protein